MGMSFLNCPHAVRLYDEKDYAIEEGATNILAADKA